MKTLSNYYYSLVLIACTLLSISLYAQTDVDHIKRMPVAVETSEGVYVGWPLLGSDLENISFNIYRITNGGSEVKLNDTPIMNSTNYFDSAADLNASNSYFIRPVLDNIEQVATDTVGALDDQFMSVPLMVPAGGTTPTGESYIYTPNDVSVSDLDGDGEYEIVLKWDPTNAHDNSHAGYTGNVYLDGYELDGTRLWRIDLGKNIRAGAHYTQYMVYDLDGDGKAEVACKTADGTTDNSGTVIGDGSADYRNSSGYVLSGPEYLTVFSGETGDILHTTNYNPARGNVNDWGDGYGNRVDRFNAAIGYFDGVNPHLLMCRGYYTRTVLVAYRFIAGQLEQQWIFDTKANGLSSYEGQGNHQISIGDVDADGKDEVIFGAMCVDHDGTGLWNTGLGHGDALHVTDMILDREGLEVFGPHEGTGNPGAALKDAKTGEVLWQTPNQDVGRAVAGDLVPEFPGVEVWGGTDGLRNAIDTRVGNTPNSHNFVVWWDGDLSRELLDGISIRKYSYAESQENVIFTATGCLSNNGTKATPNLQADILGDWREEVILRTEDNSTLRIYTTVIPTEYRIKTLMHDRQYRLAIAWQNVGYNQPPHPGIYIGSDMFTATNEIPPNPPTGLSNKAYSTYVDLSWDLTNETDIASYSIYKSTGEGGVFTLLTDTVTQNSFKDESVVVDMLHSYYLLAKDINGNLSSASDTTSGIPTDRPDVPEGAQGRAGNNQNLIYWYASGSEGVIGYNLYVSETSGSNYSKVNTELITDTAYIHTGLISTTTYYYVVKAMASKESFESQEIAVIPGEYSTIQAENGVNNGGFVENNHVGFNGDGFVNFDGASTLSFPYVYNETGGWYLMAVRYANGSGNRTGTITINDSTFSYTMALTGDWTNYVRDTIMVRLNSNFSNTITFTSTGGDFGNLDEISFGGEEIDITRFDCLGKLDGTAFLDDCGVCVGSSTGYDACYAGIQDGVSYKLIFDHSDLCMAGQDGGDKVMQEDCLSGDVQSWIFEKGEAGYLIKNEANGLYLNLRGNTIVTLASGREWRLETVEEGLYRIVWADYMNLGIAIPNMQLDPGVSPIITNRTNSTSANLFRVVEASLFLSNEPEPNSALLYPNPFKDNLNVKFNYTGKDVPVIRISDISGRLLVQGKMRNGSVVSQYEYSWFDTPEKRSKVDSGIYIITITAGGSIVTSEKVVLTD
ncbi:T9SS type A sorting domain-containing protein [Marinoscillum sp. MHG1-6]|uniref:rhamnogalacturonan lyase family protein n=1 Tax=Marinoscillum sp. MHG1-6 TaxID=2959627 RepID=UPI0021570EFD|nr:T9SS type A sorting domain-containing protein [Marinoscillum sp. MHG1-6]